MSKTTGILIHYKNEVLLFKRSNKVRYNGIIGLYSGGHVELGESVEEAAKRGGWEETIKFKSHKLIGDLR